MKRLIDTALAISILTLVTFINAEAQTVVQKEKIPSDVPVPIRNLIEKLYSSDPATLAESARNLGAWGKDATASIPFLIGILHDARQLKVVTTYGPAISKEGAAFLPGKSTTAGFEAAAALARMGEPAFQPLLEALKTGQPGIHNWKDSYVQQAAAHGLGLLKDKRAADVLLQVLIDSSSPLAREKVAFALGEVGDTRAVEPLIATLKDDNPEVRLAAIAALGNLRDHRATEPLLLKIKGQDNPVRLTAAQALVNLGKPRPLAQLLALLGDEDHLVEEAAVFALGQIGVEDKEESVVALLAPKLNSEHMARIQAATFLTKMGDKYTLAEIKDQMIIDSLIANLGHGDERAAVAAASLLGAMRIRRAVPALTAVLKNKRGWGQDSDINVSIHAARALGKINDPVAVDSLIAVAREMNCGYSPGCAEISKSLGQITGQDLGYEADVWQRWWTRNRRRFVGRSGGGANTPAPRRRRLS